MYRTFLKIALGGLLQLLLILVYLDIGLLEQERRVSQWEQRRPAPLRSRGKAAWELASLPAPSYAKKLPPPAPHFEPFGELLHQEPCRGGLVDEDCHSRPDHPPAGGWPPQLLDDAGEPPAGSGTEYSRLP